MLDDVTAEDVGEAVVDPVLRQHAAHDGRGVGGEDGEHRVRRQRVDHVDDPGDGLGVVVPLERSQERRGDRVGLGFVADVPPERFEEVVLHQREVRGLGVDAESELLVDSAEHLPRGGARLHERAVEVEEDAGRARPGRHR